MRPTSLAAGYRRQATGNSRKESGACARSAWRLAIDYRRRATVGKSGACASFWLKPEA
jgi:hypothetical protein